MYRLMTFILIFLTSFHIAAQEEVQEELPEEIQSVTLSELAEKADVIALVRVLDTDYEYTREFPSGGTAFLKVLIPYKVTIPLEDILDVYEEGLHPGECYFDNPTVLEEGRRYLVFLKLSEDVKGQYNGLEQGCRLEVLVRNDDQYAVRYPATGILLSDDLGSHATHMSFADNYAVLEDEDISPDERKDLLEKGFLEQQDLQFKYTHGIELREFRELLGPAGLTLDRSLK
jgi:hypothetical protein